MAANNYTFRFMSVSFMPIFGVSTAVTALVGRYLGMKRPDVAAKRAHLGFFVAASYTFLCGMLFFFGRRTLVGLFTRDPEVLRVGELLLTFAAAYQVFDAMYIIYNGALRGAGDTFVPAMVTGGLCWGFTVAGAYAVARLFPSLGVVGPWTMAMTYGAILGSYLLVRFQRGRWKDIRLGSGPAAGFDVIMPPAGSNVLVPSDKLPDLQLTPEP
jgi:MATE family multidrug resistance protein